MSITVKRGDQHPITFNVNADLTGSTVRLLCKGRTLTVLDTTVTDAAEGVVTHDLDGTLAVGAYLLELEITQGDTIVTAPTNGYTRLTVKPDLG